jgi:hypothetical protein
VEADSLQIGKKYITFFYEQTETLWECPSSVATHDLFW